SPPRTAWNGTWQSLRDTAILRPPPRRAGVAPVQVEETPSAERPDRATCPPRCYRPCSNPVKDVDCYRAGHAAPRRKRPASSPPLRARLGRPAALSALLSGAVQPAAAADGAGAELAADGIDGPVQGAAPLRQALVEQQPLHRRLARQPGGTDPEQADRK